MKSRVFQWLLALAIAFTFSSTLPAADWPQFLGPNRDGHSAETGLVDHLDKAKVLWKIDTAAGFSGPVVVGDRLFHFEQAAGQAILRCLNTKDGSEIWSKSYPCRFIGGLAGGGAGPRATPVIAKDSIITFGPKSRLRCYAYRTGELRWERELETDYSIPPGFFGTSSTPLVHENRVIVNVGANDAGIVAFNLENGETVWEATEDEASYASPIIANVGDQPTVLVFARTGLHSLQTRTGKQQFFFRWRARIRASVNAATPVLAGEKVFITSSYNTGGALLKLTDGGYEQVWAGSQYPASQYNTPIYREGFLYCIDGRADAGLADLCCIDVKTGARKWNRQYGCASLLAVDGKVILFSDDGELEMAKLTTEGFTSLGKLGVNLGRDTRSHPALSNGVLYVRGAEQLVAIDLKPN